MAFVPTAEQIAVIDADLVPQCVVACPGSGKTATAVRRLLEVRRRLEDARGYTLLLSYSNVAVQTFRDEFALLASQSPGLSRRVRIETVDSFLTNYILRPHGARAMGAKRQPFLVNGSELFLSNYNIFDGSRNRGFRYLTLSLQGDAPWQYFIREKSSPVIQVDGGFAQVAMKKLATTGGYTHELGRYWALMALAEEETLLNALARRFPHIIIDEAQDVGSVHGAMLSLLAAAGSTVSLVGDPNQAIFEFAGADGNFLRDYAKEPDVTVYPLTQNRRSLGGIVDVANLLADTKSSPFRSPGTRPHGAYYLRYDAKNVSSSLALFEAVLTAANYAPGEATILCRGRPYVAQLTGAAGDGGTGATRYFAEAAVLRDRSGDIAKAFEHALGGVIRLLENPPIGLQSEILGSPEDAQARNIRNLTWRFLRDSAKGIPLSTLKAESQWHPRLKTAVNNLLTSIEGSTSLKRLPTWTKNLTRRSLLDEALWQVDLAGGTVSKVRVDTVHKAKGEGIPVVMYLAHTDEINAMIRGTGSEEGRIGYVAVTRARDLLILGVPKTAKAPVISAVEAKGFKPWIA